MSGKGRDWRNLRRVVFDLFSKVSMGKLDYSISKVLLVEVGNLDKT